MAEYRYEISVWNIVEGDVVRKLWDASEDDLEAIEEQYGDEPFYEVVIDREWEDATDE